MTITSTPLGLLLPRSNEEEDATCKSRETNHTNHDTSRDGSGIVTALGVNASIGQAIRRCLTAGRGAVGVAVGVAVVVAGLCHDNGLATRVRRDGRGCLVRLGSGGRIISSSSGSGRCRYGRDGTQAGCVDRPKTGATT